MLYWYENNSSELKDKLIETKKKERKKKAHSLVPAAAKLLFDFEITRYKPIIWLWSAIIVCARARAITVRVSDLFSTMERNIALQVVVRSFSLVFCGTFTVKVPMIPIHIWLPEAHVKAPMVRYDISSHKPSAI